MNLNVLQYVAEDAIYAKMDCLEFLNTGSVKIIHLPANLYMEYDNIDEYRREYYHRKDILDTLCDCLNIYSSDIISTVKAILRHRRKTGRKCYIKSINSFRTWQ